MMNNHVRIRNYKDYRGGGPVSDIISLNGHQNPELIHCRDGILYQLRADKLYHMTAVVSIASFAVISTSDRSFPVPRRWPCWWWWRMLSETALFTERVQTKPDNINVEALWSWSWLQIKNTDKIFVRWGLMKAGVFLIPCFFHFISLCTALTVLICALCL